MILSDYIADRVPTTRGPSWVKNSRDGLETPLPVYPEERTDPVGPVRARKPACALTINFLNAELSEAR